MLKLVATLAGGGAITLENPLWFELNKRFDLPCADLAVRLRQEGELGEIAEAALYDGEERLFYGIVDRQAHTLDQNGAVLSLECRGPEALLVDNEAMPGVRYYANLSALVRAQAAQYGIKGVKGGDPYLSRYTVYKGCSVWRALDLFCRQTLNRSPRVDEDGYLDVSPPAGKRALTISNLAQGAWGYTRLVKEINRYGVVSSVKLQTRTGYYGTEVKNADALGVRRTRLWIPSNEWANLPKKGAEEIIRASMLEKYRWVVTIPDIVRCDIGDTVNLCDKPFDGQALYVGEINYTCGEGVFTTLTLYGRQYVS